MADYVHLAHAAFDACRLPAPPRTVDHALAYLTRLLSLLPPAEQAGYLLKPAGENIAPLPDGAMVSVSRICYPNGDIVKVMNDVPNGGPQWVPEENVGPSRYHSHGGTALPPPGVDLTPLLMRLDDLGTRIEQHGAMFEEIVKQIGMLNRQLAKLDTEVVKKPVT